MMTPDELRTLRVRFQWKQSQLAQHLKVTPQYVGMLERGEREITPHIEEVVRRDLGMAKLQNLYVPEKKLYEEAQRAVLLALKKFPTITLNGFPYYGFDNSAFDAKKKEHESRAQLFSDYSLAEVSTAIQWIDAVKIIKEPRYNSYAAKHRAERWGRENNRSSYVPNGAMIVAAVYRKVPIQLVDGTPNAQLGLDADPRKEARPGTFVHWLGQQVERGDPLGDLARDVVQDRDFPVDTSSGPRLRSYLRGRGACDAAVEALDLALDIWRAERRG